MAESPSPATPRAKAEPRTCFHADTIPRSMDLTVDQVKMGRLSVSSNLPSDAVRPGIIVAADLAALNANAGFLCKGSGLASIHKTRWGICFNLGLAHGFKKGPCHDSALLTGLTCFIAKGRRPEKVSLVSILLSDYLSFLPQASTLRL